MTKTKTAAKKLATASAAKKATASAAKNATASAPKKAIASASTKPARNATTSAATGAGIAFASAGFRLTVINELLDLGYFADELEAAQEHADEVEDDEIDPRVQRFVDGIALTESLLAKVVKIAPDGGDEIYAALVPVWDGEDDRFDIDSLEDVRLLPNLERVSLYCMVREGIDLAPLRDVPGLTHVNIALAEDQVKDARVLDELRARGVEVTRG